jgi:hypothetical protein
VPTFADIRGSSLVALAVLVTSAHARAEAPGAPRLETKTSRVELGAGVFARYDLAQFCEQDLDLVTCYTNRVFAGLAAAPRIRLSPVVSLGLAGGYGWKLGSDGGASSDGSHAERSITTYHVEGEGRFHLLDAASPDLWLGVGAGVTVLSDVWKSYAPNGERVGSSEDTDVGPLAGVALGVDFRVAPLLALGPELRAGVLGYDETQYFAALAVTGTFFVPR